MSFWIGRIAQALCALFAVSILAFLFLELAPGDYLDRMRLSPQISQETLEAMRVQYGLDRPFVARYWTWLGAVVTGTWGYSFAYGIAVAPLVWGRVMNTLVLGASALAVAWALALPVGVWWATRRSTAAGFSMGFLTSVILGFPELILALILLVLAERSGAFPVGGMRSIGAEDLSAWGRARDLLWHLVLPVTTLALPAFAMLVRHVKAAVEDVMAETFVLNARALGVTGRRLVLHHVLRPAANPLISIAGLSVASLLSGSFIVEVVMGWPGLGPFLLEAIRARDVHVVIGGVMCSAVLVIAGGLLTDLVLYLNDPRMAAR
ncbi:MAG: ABC transporter permease [Acidobacteria bacterium]|nr:MAG: ABC transporter permease [Acidobacteriota bacterium]